MRLSLPIEPIPMTHQANPLTLIIEASRFDDIPGFYQEINRIFMQGEDWTLGESLDALDDLLYGGYGAAAGEKSFRVIWRDMEKSRHDLGTETTRNWLSEKLDHPDRFNLAHIRQQINALNEGRGQTYFEIVMEIFAGHPEIELIPG